MEKFKNMTIIFAVVFISIFAVAAQAAGQNKAPGVLLQEGLYAEEMEGDVDKAIEIYEQIIENKSAQDSHKAQALYRLGMLW